MHKPCPKEHTHTCVKGTCRHPQKSKSQWWSCQLLIQKDYHSPLILYKLKEAPQSCTNNRMKYYRVWLYTKEKEMYTQVCKLRALISTFHLTLFQNGSSVAAEGTVLPIPGNLYNQRSLHIELSLAWLCFKPDGTITLVQLSKAHTNFHFLSPAINLLFCYDLFQSHVCFT